MKSEVDETNSSGARNGESGRSILEIAVVVMIAGVIAATSVALFANGKARYDLNRKAQNLSWQIESARSLAMKYNRTLTLGFGQDGSLGLTCQNCDAVKSELPSTAAPSNVSLSSTPTLSIKGNGTISGSSGITLTDTKGQQVSISITNSGKVSVGSVTQPTN